MKMAVVTWEWLPSIGWINKAPIQLCLNNSFLY